MQWIYLGYTWIYSQGKICRQISLIIWILFFGQFVHLLGRVEEGWVKGVDGGIVILASCEHHFISVHKNNKILINSTNTTILARLLSDIINLVKL